MPHRRHTAAAARAIALAGIAAIAAGLTGCGSSSTVTITGDLYGNRAGLPMTQNGRIADARVNGPAYGLGVGDALGVALHANPSNAADDGTRTAFVITDNN